jgi:hypothetical protein
MALTLSQDDLDAIEALNPHAYVGGKVAGATVTQDFATQTHTQTLADGTVRKDFAFVEEE